MMNDGNKGKSSYLVVFLYFFMDLTPNGVARQTIKQH